MKVKNSFVIFSVVLSVLFSACTDPVDSGSDNSPPVTKVTGVSIYPATAEVDKGETQQFSATVTGTNNPAQTVTWTVTGGVSGTGIDTKGLLTVAGNETAKTLTVKAVSTIDPSVSGTATVTVKEAVAIPSSILTIEQYPASYGEVNLKSGPYSQNTSIDIKATPNSGYQFIGWTVRVGTATFGKSANASTTVTIGSDATIRANYLPASADYQGEIGKFSLNVTGAFTSRLNISYLKDDGAWARLEATGDITMGQTKTADPGDKGIPDGSLVRIYSWVFGTVSFDAAIRAYYEPVAGDYGATYVEGDEYFMYKKGSTKTASYTHSGTVITSKLTFNGLK